MAGNFQRLEFGATWLLIFGGVGATYMTTGFRWIGLLLTAMGLLIFLHRFWSDLKRIRIILAADSEQHQYTYPSVELLLAIVIIPVVMLITGYVFFFSGSSPQVATQKQSDIDKPNESVGLSSHFDIRLDNLYFVRFGSWTDIRSSGTALVVVTSVHNRNGPSVAEEWKVTIQVGKHEYIGQIMTPPDTFFFNYDHNECIRLYGKDSLTHKTIVPIPSEDVMHGILIYNFPNVSPEELMREHAVIRVECEDFDGKASRKSFLMSDMNYANAIPTGITTEIGKCSDIQTRPHSEQPKQ